MKLRSKIRHIGFGLVLAVGASAPLIGCNGPSLPSGNQGQSGDVGSVGLALTVAPGVTISSASFTISGPNSFSRTGTVDVSQSSSLSFVIGNLPAGSGYSIELDATSSDGNTTCVGTATFTVTAHSTTAVNVHLTCHEAVRTGSVSVNGVLNVCPVADGITANPGDITVGHPVALAVTAHDSDNGPSPLSYQWTAASGAFSNATSATPTFTCSTAGPVTSR